MVNGPKVEIYVGETSKQFQLPKELLCYVSQYFDRCFNGHFVEARSQRLELRDVEVEHFEHIANWICRGPAPEYTENAKAWARKGFGFTKRGISYCLETMKLADRLDIPGACELAAEGLTVFLTLQCRSGDCYGGDLKSEDIELVFRAFPDGHSMRATVAQTIMRDALPRHLNQAKPKYLQAMKTVDGLAAEIIIQLQSSFVKATIAHPLGGREIVNKPSRKEDDK
jgi:hypothetical protein